MVKLFVRYCHLDRRHEYGLVFTEELKFHYSVYWNYWVWFHLGNLMKGQNHKKYHLFPYAFEEWKDTKLLKQYKTNDSAKKIAERLFLAMSKHKTKYGKKHYA